MPELVIDMDDAVKRAQLVNSLAKLRGPYRIGYKQYRPRRSDRQNRFYWPCFVHPLAEWMKEQGHDDTTDDQAHDVLKHKFLRVTRSTADGDTLTFTRSTATLDTSEFNAYLDRCANWLAEFCGIIVPEPDEYHEKETTAAPAHRTNVV